MILKEDLRYFGWWAFRFSDEVLSFVPDCFCAFISGEVYLVTMPGSYDVKNGRAFLCDDVLGRSCFWDVFAEGVLLRFLAAASTNSVKLWRCDCLSWKKAFSGIRRCMSIWRVVGDCIATSFPACGLGCSSVGDCENTDGDLVISRLNGSNEVVAVILLVVIGAVVRPTAAIGVKKRQGAGKTVKQSWWLRVPSMCLCVSSLSGVGWNFLGLFLVGTLDVGGGSKNGFSRS